ncbi:MULTISPECIES: hypothetical protein [unclassified Mucilaginibacter]|uniref:hypothetical protein n=1 Tax=unclassified Mucilaginibacter TaxID=2617802 RepID=UPI002AC94CD5|nr:MULTISPECIES: hypothetical protein [unclassified Mucilaginibacter]MEB0262655.1 hypothetical protein [Mucilaginibacter sp. 10I4]MEB0280607.1 hypothetical protein [Mucilaginibacter sp. 10B2]MEB0300280.1 hypothetical protein [Mucilaginibacter sp. 5C4]WPX24975.1 hypothetical protein RHM67_06830 [Mucilaginibacter sp. 5C4]
MGLFGDKSLKDPLVEIEWEKDNGIWDLRKRSYGCGAIGVAALFIAIAVIVITTQNHDTNLSWGKVKPGDALYVDDLFITDTAKQVSFRFQKLIRPITTADIDTMKISLADKRKMAAQLDTSLKKAIMIEFGGTCVPRDSMFKYNDASVALFVSKDNTIAMSDGGSEEKWYVVKPNTKLIAPYYTSKIPRGYISANDLYYLRPYDIRLEAPTALTKYKTANPIVSPKAEPDSAIKLSENLL